MAYPQHSTSAPDAELRAYRDALSDVFAAVLEHAGPKREAKARRELEALATQLETHHGRHLPAPNIVPIRSSWSEMLRADEERRRQRAERAGVIRSLLVQFFAEARS